VTNARRDGNGLKTPERGILENANSAALLVEVQVSCVRQWIPGMLVAIAGLGFACGLLAGFVPACFLEAKLLALALLLRVFLGLCLPFRCGRGATLGFSCCSW
jgi:hypothetical protein